LPGINLTCLSAADNIYKNTRSNFSIRLDTAMMEAIETTLEIAAPPLSLEQQRDLLATRLEAGFVRIEEAEATGRNVARWEQVWLELLEEYESVCDRIAGRS
jgi:hypothetical protein